MKYLTVSHLADRQTPLHLFWLHAVTTPSLQNQQSYLLFYLYYVAQVHRQQQKSSTMVWPFCPDCHNTLTVNASGTVRCSVCNHTTNLSAYSESALPSRTTTSADRPVPLWAKSDEEQAALRTLSEPKRMVVEEPCVKCGAGEVGFYTVQLRSVDEGQTVFYECPKCSYTWSVNN